MLELFAPAGLLGLLALGVPALLHLRRPPPPTVRIGNLRHLSPLAKKRPQSWRWHDRLLLALRLAIMALLALGLARPRWHPGEDEVPRRWALVDPAGKPTGDALGRLESLQKAGAEVRLFGDGFPKARVGEEISATPVALWSGLRELDVKLPQGSALTVFSPAPLASLRGERPTLHHVSVDWVETSPASPPGPPRADDTPSIPPAATTLRILILCTPDRSADASRLAAAAGAAVPTLETSAPRIEVSVNPEPGTTRPAPDWVFCLGGAQPAALAEVAGVTDARNLFTDAGDAPVLEEEISPGVIVASELAGAPDVTVRKRVALADGSPDAVVLWTDAVGRPLLTCGKVGPGEGRRRWSFAGRFDPAWNELSGTNVLPEVLRAWFFPTSPVSDDLRLAGALQASPRMGTPGGDRPRWPWESAGETVDLRPWVIGLAALGFLLEWTWSLRRDVSPSARLSGTA